MSELKKLVLEINNEKSIWFVKLANADEGIYTLSSSSGEDINQLLTINRSENGGVSTSFSVLNELKIEDQIVYAYVKNLGNIQRHPLGNFIGWV